MKADWRRCVLGAVVVACLASAVRAPAQSVPGSLADDIAAVQAEIRKAEGDEERFGSGLIKSLISLRLATLRQTLGVLDQRAKARGANTTLQYTIDGRPFVPPADAAQQVAALELEIAKITVKLAKQEAEAARYSGGLIQATALATVATLRQTQAMLEQKRLALKYGLPQFVSLKEQAASVSVVSTPRASSSAGSDASTRSPGHSAPQAAAIQVPQDCMKVAFGSYCLGAPTSSLPTNPAKKTDELWVYVEPAPTMVVIVEGRVGSAGRLYSPGTWLTYTGLESDLVEKYGEGKDLSFFPSYADDSSSKETAISLKRGRAARSWQQEGYTIQLKWESSDNVVLIYYHDELEAKRAAKKKDQL